jgi:hypothetical protein
MRAGSLRGALARLAIGQIQRQVVHIVEDLVPLSGWLDVDGPDATMTALTQLADEMSSDESARASNENEIVLFHQAPAFICRQRHR